jgi:predicted transcriptional regulator
MQAKDVMTAKVVSVSKDTLIHEVVSLLREPGNPGGSPLCLPAMG